MLGQLKLIIVLVKPGRLLRLEQQNVQQIMSSQALPAELYRAQRFRSSAVEVEER